MKCQSHLICCKIKKLKNLFFYNSKPKLETDFGIKKYKRKYMTCVNCKHMFAYFDFNLDNLYDENYSLKAYGNIKKLFKWHSHCNSGPMNKNITTVDGTKEIQLSSKIKIPIKSTKYLSSSLLVLITRFAPKNSD